MGGEDDDGKIFVDEGVGAVLHFAGGITFGVNVGNFLELEGALEGDGIMNAATQIEKVGVAKELASERFILASLVGLQNHFNFVGDAREFLEERLGGFAGQF